MHRILLLAGFLPLILTACGGAQIVSPTSTPTAAPTTEAATPTAESGELTGADPLAVDVSGLDAGTFTATFSGKYNFTMTGPAVVTALPNGYSLSLAGASAKDGDMPSGSALVFLFPADIAPGTYAITLPFSEAQASGGLAAHYTNLAGSSGAQPTPEAYGIVASGHITIESASPFTGAFEVVFDANGESLTATGVFNEAMLLSSGA